MLTALALLLALQPFPSDTPPKLPVPVERLEKITNPQDLAAATLLSNGQRAPASLRLPQLANREEVLAYMADHYPWSLRDKLDLAMPWFWLAIDEQGRPGEMVLIRSSGAPAFDSLSLAALKKARFTPAEAGGKAVAVWTPIPVQAAYENLAKSAPREVAPLEDGPVFTPYTQKPVLQNRNDVARELVRNYPPKLREAGTGGTALYWVLLDENGNVLRTQLRTTSGNDELDAAAERVVRAMRFSPALNGTTPVKVWIQLPILFRAR